jgi:hypothetical protein
MEQIHAILAHPFAAVISHLNLGHLLIFAMTILVGGAFLLFVKAYAIYAGISNIQQIVQHVANKRTGTVVGVYSPPESWGPFTTRFAAEIHTLARRRG